MGHSIRMRGDDSGRTLDSVPGFDRHVATLVTQLEELLAERARYGYREADTFDIRRLSAPPAAAPCHAVTIEPTGFPNGRAMQARELIRQRRLRSRFLPATLFAEPAWDMLLDLYAAHYEGKQVAVKSLCIAAAVPSTTALRSIEAMTEQGCIVRQRDPTDGRRIFLTLSNDARGWLDAYFDDLAD